MDGSAAAGLLELVQLLHANRSEGCSPAAFIGSAANRHFHVLEWLYDHYPEVANPAQELVVAAQHNRIEALSFLLPKVTREQVEPALEAAAANGHVAVLENLLRRPYSMERSLLAAAENGRAQVVQFLLERGHTDRYQLVNPALIKAAEGGHCNVVELLVDKSDEYTLSDVLITAAADGRGAVVELLMRSGQLGKLHIARALEKAAEFDQCNVVKLLLEGLAGEEETSHLSGGVTIAQAVKCIVNWAFLAAVDQGRVNVVKLLIDTDSDRMSDALITASSNSQLEVLEFLLEYCQGSHRRCDDFDQSITEIAETAASTRSMEMAELLVAKCDTLSTGGALRIAVDNDDLDMLGLLVVKSNAVSIQEAVVSTAATNRVQILEFLLERCNAVTIEHALIRVAPVGNSTVSRLLLGKCDPGAHARIFDNAASHGLDDLVQVLLDKMSTHSIRCALISAAMNGHADVVKVLMDKSDSTGITCAFEMAAIRGRVGVVELLRSRCDASSISFAASAGDANVIHLLRNKRARRE
ncbi:hypothetical protein PF005_g4468 [Phytophthora fragariae]|uniref:Uncharacterized protein n=1 Tax=Phytophthora fragariae TaxID=53985 RepID=A0A6A3S7C9_9STRA|nr:hypothetical protein PF003_g12304 [Phytophthora fragariae]KAE8932937.1 hypothetical protein PF009_g17040 [Phytophthora fragariae]KAE8986441.1 hypothetical protein PF011_g19983 [Phytophthora fragariae]KAE9085163.1 hypothetical protein PF007_g21242 [Phytophthora fragariae]KAE9111359.1 hypothetical protein PF006_g20231 [Phytophthora fragariae]